MPIFSSQLGKVESQTPEAGIHNLANHVRRMQEELEYRLANLDSTNITEIALEDTNISMDGAPINDMLTATNSLTLAVSNGYGSSVIQLRAGDMVLASTTIRFSGMVFFEDLEDPDSGTIIDGGLLKTGTVIADSLIGSVVGLKDEDGYVQGAITITDADSAEHAVDIGSNGGLRLRSTNGGSVWIEAANYARMGLGSEGISVGPALFPGADEEYDLGRDTEKWNDVWAANDSIRTSDRNEKHDIRYDLSAYEKVFDKLQPAVYKLNNGTSDRDHIGLVAQDVEQALDECGMDGKDFAGLVKFEKKDGSDGYGLRYGEFIGLLIQQVQDLKARVAELEAKHGQND